MSELGVEHPLKQLDTRVDICIRFPCIYNDLWKVTIIYILVLKKLINVINVTLL